MLGEGGCDLLKDLCSTSDNIPPYRDEGFRRVLEEMGNLYEENQKDLWVNFTKRALESEDVTGSQNSIPNLALRQAALERNKRCILTYMQNRLQRIRAMRWELGSILPHTVKINLSKQELLWLKNYNKLLASYMGTIGCGRGLDLTQDNRPPQSFYIEVKSNADYGKFELDSGDVVLLKKNGVYHLPRAQCEVLVRQGILEHIT